MASKSKEIEQKDGGISKWKLALGAASLFFFVVGVKRSFRTEEGQEISQRDVERSKKRGDQEQKSFR